MSTGFYVMFILLSLNNFVVVNIIYSKCLNNLHKVYLLMANIYI